MFTLEEKENTLGVYIDRIKKEIKKLLDGKKEGVVMTGGRFMSRGDVADRGCASMNQYIKCILRNTSISSLQSLNNVLVKAWHKKKNITAKDFVSLWSLMTVAYGVNKIEMEKSFLIVPVGGGHNLGDNIYSISADTSLALSLIGDGEHKIGDKVETRIGGHVVHGEIIDLI